MKFFEFIKGVLSDPNDQQGSTKRLCLLLFVLVLLLLLIGVTIKEGKLPIIPDSILNLVYFMVGTLVGAVSIEKGIAAAKAIKGVGDGSVSDGQQVQ